MNNKFVNGLCRALTLSIALPIVCALVPAVSVAQDEHQHDHNVHAVKKENKSTAPKEVNHIESTPDEHEEAGVKLSSEQIALAEIKSEVVTAKHQNSRIYAPAELKANGYTTYVVSPRVDSVVIKRHISLGEHVSLNQPLVTLFSEVIAQEQADYSINFAEYNRVNKLSTQVVSEKYASDVKTRYEASTARLKAFGLTKKAIKQLSANKDSPLGEYTLEAQQSGLVLSDEFQQGQRMEAGQSLVVLADESSLWVEASLSPNTKLLLSAGTEAELVVNNATFTAQVIQETHTIDPKTRTRIVRLLVKNNNHQLHSGMFGDVYFNTLSHEPILAVPESALMRSPDGDWVVFVEEKPQLFVAKEVELGRSLGDSTQPLREIIGIASGQKIVTQGAFFIASEQAKGGFDPHNH